MAERWTEDELRQFLQVREGLRKTGFSKDVAAAQARRVIEERLQQGEPRRHGEGETKDDLYQEAKRFNITGRSKMDKEALERAVAHRRSELGLDDDADGTGAADDDE